MEPCPSVQLHDGRLAEANGAQTGEEEDELKEEVRRGQAVQRIQPPVYSAGRMLLQPQTSAQLPGRAGNITCQ